MVATSQQSQFKISGLFLVGFLTVITLSVLYIPIRADITSQHDTLNTQGATETIVNATNTLRGEQGLPPLTINDTLNVAAREHAGDMVLRHYVGQNTLEGKTPPDWITEAGSPAPTLWAENRATNIQSTADAITIWQSNPESLSTLLNPHFTETGVGGKYDAATKSWVYVQLFSGP